MGERNGFVVMLMQAVFLKSNEKIMLCAAGPPRMPRFVPNPFTSGEEAVEVFGKVVMRGSCRVNGLERL
jgi:hypothetical protein